MLYDLCSEESLDKSGMAHCQNERKLQTSFPLVHFSLGTPLKSTEKSSKDHTSNIHVSRHIQGQKINLPQVESLSRILTATESRTGMEKGRMTRDHTNYLGPCLSTLNVPFSGKGDIKLDDSVHLASMKAALERPSAKISRPSDCPNCKKERRIRGEYDKFLLQSRRDKEALQKRIVQLEADLKRSEECQKSVQVEDKAVSCSMTFLVETETQLERSCNSEEAQAQETKLKQRTLLFELEELKLQLEKTMEQEKQKTPHLESKKEACLEKNAQLQKCMEKVRLQNDILFKKGKILQEALVDQSLSWKMSSTTLNTEVLTISDNDTLSAGFPEIIPALSRCTDGATQDGSKQNGRYVDGTIVMKQDAVRKKDGYKQLERERNLLLDVMVIMYTRRWFLEEAIPYVRRTLKRCGINSEHGK